MKNTGSTVQRLTFSALMLSLASVLSFLELFHLPQAGGVTIASMLPIILIAYRYGFSWGISSAFCYSLLQMLFGIKDVSSFFMPGDNQQVLWKAILICLLDYIIAYTVLGIGGLFRKGNSPSVALTLGSITALIARYIVHLLSGAIFFGAWAEWWFTDVMGGDFGAEILSKFSGFGLSLIYSAIYNGCYMIPEIIITAIAAFVVSKIHFITGEKTAVKS